MKSLSYIVLAAFFLHYYIALALITLVNLLKFTFKILAQTPSEKQKIFPFQLAHKDVFTSCYQFISQQGFVIDIYTFQTNDKVPLEMWRLYKKDAKLTKPYPILLMHGLLDCSVSWFLQADKTKCLPYILAEQGYEVWLGNNRGNIISQKEEVLDEAFWDFNLDHLIEHDQPAIINGVLEISRKQKLIYVGHSQGSVQFILSLGLHDQLASKIAGFIGMGTIISFKDMKNHSLINLLDKLKIVQTCRWLGFKKVLVFPRALTTAVGVLIYNCQIYYDFLMMFVRMLCGYSHKNKISQSMFGVMITHEPGGSSANNTLQWIQCYRNGIMRKFDYGPEKNLQVYGSEVPETYCLQHLRNLPFNSYLFRGTKDAVMDKSNFSNLTSYFDAEKTQTFQLQDYHHLEYIWSETAHIDCFPKIMEIIKNIPTS